MVSSSNMKVVGKTFSVVASNKILVAVMIIAAVLRFVGTNPGYNQFHADEGITYSAAVSMIKNGNLDPLRYDYPALVPEINYVFFRLVFIPLNWAKYYLAHIPEIIDGTVHVPIAPLEEKKLFQTYVLGERNINALHWGRYVTALFSLANVFLTYLLAKRIFEKILPNSNVYIGLFAALLLTFNYKHVVNSHIGLPDVYNAFFVLLTLLGCVRLWRDPSTRNYILVGIAAGLSFSVKYQIFALFPLGLAHIYFATADGSSLNLKKLFNPRIFLALATVSITSALINPYLFIHFEEATQAIRDVSLKYGMGTNQLNIYPFSYFYHIDYGAPQFFLVIAGLLIAAVKFRRETLIFLSFLIPFMFALIYYSRGGFYIRNFITSTPILIIFASLAIWGIFKFAKDKFGSRVGFMVLLVVLPAAVFTPARNAIVNSLSYTRPWGYDIMRPWIQENLPPDVVVASHPFDAVNLKIKNKRTEFDIAGSWSLAEHKENGASYALLDLNWAGIPFYFWMSYGFEDLRLYWNKPLDILRNTYFGIATEEQFRYQVYAATKPWQAPDTHLILVKIPEWPQVEMLDVHTFGFDNDTERWTIQSMKNQSGSEYRFDQELGYGNKGSLVSVPSGAKLPIVRTVSQPIRIKEGHLYKVEGFLKTEANLDSREREGFLRVDFYGQNFDPEKVGMISSVSSRVYGSNDWVKKEIVERAPQGADFLTVSFQVHVTTKTKIWLDDVVVRESRNQVEDITARPPYQTREIDLNYVYPNSHGNL